MMLILRCFSHKAADFATSTLEVCRLIRYEEKWEKIEKKILFVISRNKKNSRIDLSYRIIETDEKIMPL